MPKRELESALTAARRAIVELDAVLDRLDAAVQARTPFTRATTVHAAWARHPGVRGVFSELGLPACDQCSVGADETLEEAAYGYRVELAWLLGRLNSLL